MTTTTRRRWLRNGLAFVVVAGCIAFVVSGIVRDIDQVDLEIIVWAPVARAALILVVAYVFRALSFAAIVRSMAPGAPWVRSARVFLAAQLGRYVPGKIWQVAGAGYLAGRLGVSASASVIGTAYYVVVHNLVGALLGAWAVVQLFPNAASSRSGLAVLAIGAVAVAFASSPGFPRLMRWVGKKFGRNLEFEAIPLWVAFFTVGSSLVVWALFGVAVVDVFGAVVPDDPAPTLVSAITNMAAASVAGLAVLVAPSGIGVREAVFVAAFSPRYSVATAGLVALLLRLLMSLVELVLSALSLGGAAKD